MKWIKRLIAFVAIIVLLVSSYSIVGYLKEVRANKNINENLTREYKKNNNIDSLKAINENMVGWIKLPETSIDYPVVKGEDNSFYLDHDIEGKASIHGSIFMDSRNKVTDDKNLIIYGHHMKDGSMFRDLVKYKDEDFFRENKTVFLRTDHGDEEYEIFSVLVTKGDSGYIDIDFDSKDDFLTYIGEISKDSLLTRDIDFQGDEEIITLSTCSYEFQDARTVIFGVKK